MILFSTDLMALSSTLTLLGSDNPTPRAQEYTVLEKEDLGNTECFESAKDHEGNGGLD